MSSKLPNTLKRLREEKKLTQVKVAEILGVTVKTYRTWENDIEKMKSGIKSYNLIALAELYDVSIDYILGLSTCRSVDNQYIYEKIALNDEAIHALEMIKLQDANEKLNLDEDISLTDVMNFTIENSFEAILFAIRNFINIKYRIPVFFDKKNKCWICPKSDYEFSKGRFGGSDMWWLNLASSEEKPYDNKPILLTDTFYESVALKEVEKRIYELRELYDEINKSKK